MRLRTARQFVALGLSLTLALAWLSSNAAAIEGVSDAVVRGNNAFAFDLYRQAVSPDEPNFVYSPYSISSAFGMVYAGAGGSTADEIARVMRWSTDEPLVHSTLGALSDDLNARNGERFDFAVANRLWGAKDFPFKQPFLDTLASGYRAPLETLDFFADPEAGRERINAWVKDQTRNKIPNLLPIGSIGQDTGLVLTNAVYMKAKWESPFKKESTYTRDFHVSDDESLGVSMMSQRTTLRYGEFDGYQMVEMPYRDGDVSMVVVLPTAVDGLAALESGLTADALQTSIDAMAYTPVSLQMPKFRIESGLDLRTSLSALGMSEAFDGADFSRISDVGVKVGSAFHQAVIEVDEAGTEAAAATGLVMIITTGIQQPVVYEPFHADHPFLYFLRDQRTDSILFMGRMMEPDPASENANPGGILNCIAGCPIVDDVQVPEPSSALLAGIGGVFALIYSRRKWAA